MLEDIKTRLSKASSLEYDTEGEPTPFDIKVAVVALLSRAAAADGGFPAEELNSLVTCLTREFDVRETEVGELLDIARLLKDSPTKLDELCQLISSKFDTDHKERIVAILWKVVMADGKTTKLEANFAALARNSLGLSLEQAVRARVMAEKGLVGPLADA